MGRIHAEPRGAILGRSPVTVEDVLWSFETLGTIGHPRYAGPGPRSKASKQIGERSVRFTFNTATTNLPLIMGLRPILQKAQWDGKDFAESGLDDIPISSAPYVITDFEAGRFVFLNATRTIGALICPSGAAPTS